MRFEMSKVLDAIEGRVCTDPSRPERCWTWPR